MNIFFYILTLRSPIEGTEGNSCQIILPPDSTKGKTSVTYACQLSSANKVCPEGFYVIVLSTKKDFLMDQQNTKDLNYGKDLLKNLDIIDSFHFTNGIFVPKPEYANKGVYFF